MNRRQAWSMVPMVLALLTPAIPNASDVPPAVERAQEQRIELVIRNYEFMLTQPTAIRAGMPTIIILRNQDIVRHGFTSPVLAQLSVQGEGEGIVSYGRGIEGFYIDPGKTLVIRFTNDRPGNYSFRCDLHPNMKGELFMLEVPAA